MELNISSIMLINSDSTFLESDREWFLESVISHLSPTKGNFVISSRKQYADSFVHGFSLNQTKHYRIRSVSSQNMFTRLIGCSIGTITLYDMTITEIMECEEELIANYTKDPHTKFNILLSHGERLETFLEQNDIDSFGPFSRAILRKLEFIE